MPLVLVFPTISLNLIDDFRLTARRHSVWRCVSLCRSKMWLRMGCLHCHNFIRFFISAATCMCEPLGDLSFLSCRLYCSFKCHRRIWPCSSRDPQWHIGSWVTYVGSPFDRIWQASFADCALSPFSTPAGPNVDWTNLSCARTHHSLGDDEGKSERCPLSTFSECASPLTTINSL